MGRRPEKALQPALSPWRKHGKSNGDGVWGTLLQCFSLLRIWTQWLCILCFVIKLNFCSITKAGETLTKAIRCWPYHTQKRRARWPGRSGRGTWCFPIHCRTLKLLVSLFWGLWSKSQELRQMQPVTTWVMGALSKGKTWGFFPYGINEVKISFFRLWWRWNSPSLCEDLRKGNAWDHYFG